MNRIIAIADDLTGALEAGAKFAAYGMAARVTIRIHDVAGEDVAVIDTETRHLAAAEAAEIVREIDTAPFRYIYKKTDSTLRGNIGAELEALSHRAHGRIAYVPAYPALGRTVRDGVLFVHGTPVAETNFSVDPLNPIRDSRVASVLSPRCGATIFDGETDADISAAAEQILADPDFRIIAGPAAIAEAVARRLGHARAIKWPRIRTCLIVNGSLHPVSAAQIRLGVELGCLGDEWRWLSGDIDSSEPPLRIAAETGRSVNCELASRTYNGVIVFGGDTAFGILRALDCPPLYPMGEVVPGVPVSAIGGRPELLITKAGGFGAPGILAELKAAFDG